MLKTVAIALLAIALGICARVPKEDLYYTDLELEEPDYSPDQYPDFELEEEEVEWAEGEFKPRAMQCGQAPLYVRRSAERDDERIINGSAAIRGEYPFMVNIKWGWSQHWCGGAIYDKNHVISAAHCFPSHMSVSNFRLSFADLDQKKSAKIEIGQLNRQIATLYKHEQYNSGNMQNDIAIIRLNKPLSWSTMIQPVCLPTAPTTAGDPTIVMGWGYTYGTGGGDVLRWAPVPIIDHAQCQLFYKGTAGIYDNMICAGYEEGMIDSCQGDSGGPLVKFLDDKKFQLDGVVSFGAKCAAARKPGVYTEVVDYVDWIKKKVGGPVY